MKKKSFWQPKIWQRITKKLWLPAIVLSCVFFLVGIYWVFEKTPNDYQQGFVFKIFYIHVPAAWFSLGLYAMVAGLSAIYLIFKAPVSFILARSCAWTGLLLTIICLITGALWGKPMWGTYWVWDARLTSMALLGFLYIGYLLTGSAFNRLEMGWKMSSFIALFGSINLPVIKWSVEWWQTLHQPATLSKFSVPSIHNSMLLGLSFMIVAFFLYTIALISLLYQVQRFQCMNGMKGKKSYGI